MWIELSRLYAILGVEKKSLYAANIALSLGRNNRYIIRSAVRLLIHFSEKDKAHKIILQTENYKHDPWLLSAEIAVSSILEIPSKNIKYAINSLNDGIQPLSQLTELFGSIATIELNNGAWKKSKKLHT